MGSTYTDHGLTLQAPGENENTWGDINNQNVIELIDDGIWGRCAFALSGPKTLSNTSGVASEARNAILHATSGTGGTVTVPTLSKTYVVLNDTAGDLVITAGGVSATVQATERNVVVCDGTNVYALGFSGDSLLAYLLAYIDATAFEAAAGNMPGQPGNAGKFLTTDGSIASWAAPTVAQVTGAAPLASPSFTGGVAVAGDAALTGGVTQSGSAKGNIQALAALNFDLAAADYFTKAISANSTFTFSNTTASKAQAFMVTLTISSSAIPTWPASVMWDGGVVPIFGNGIHLVGFISFNGGTSWLGVVGGRAFA